MAALDAKCRDALALHRQGKIAEAEHICTEVLQHEPNHLVALQLLGLITLAKRRYELSLLEDALTRCDKAIACKPGNAGAYVNRGNVLERLERYQESLASYEKAIALEPDYEFLSGDWLHAKMRICDFSYAEHEPARISEQINRGEHASRPFTMVAISSSRVVQRKAAEIYIRRRHDIPILAPKPKHPRRDKIRLGYFSSDYHNHATMYLIAEMLEKHDRSKFESIAFSFGKEKNDEMRRRAMKSFDRFIDVNSLSDMEVAQLARRLAIDIAINMKGFTKNARTDIFAFRAAPIQVNYLGFPGTMSADLMDYIIADPMLIPTSHQPNYSEKIIYLPHTYQPNDRKRVIEDRIFAPRELGLPDKAFVYCCFNANYKLTPDIFDIWMRVLKKVEGSVLWLLQDNEAAVANLRKEAKSRGIDQRRLIFAPRVQMPEHLARHRLADLFLDTLPCNAHTTASDALWAGLPVLTQIGETFAGRVAASLLTAIGLPELITDTPESYEAMAVELATCPEKLAAIKNKLAANRLTTPLFDSGLYTKHIETAYTAMYERHHAGLPPDHIFVEP